MAPKSTVILVILCLRLHLTTSSDPDPLHDFCIPPTPTATATHHPLPCKNPVTVTASDFTFSGIKSPKTNFSATGFFGISVSPTDFPGLNTLGMSFARADLKVGGVNVPHFHPRATEIAFVIKGKVYSGFVDSTNRVFARVLEEGEVMVYPRGLVHFQMNVGEDNAVIIGCFNSQNPGVQRIPNALFGSGVNDLLLQKAFGLSPREVGVIRKRFLPKKMA